MRVRYSSETHFLLNLVATEGAANNRTIYFFVRKMTTSIMAATSRIAICFIILATFLIISSAQDFGWNDQLLEQQLDQQSLSDLLTERLAADQVPVQGETLFSIEQPLQQSLGQIAGIAVSPENQLLLFARRDRTWLFDSFDLENRYTGQEKGPIANDTIIVVDSRSGKYVRSFGNKRFYMPHGITVDSGGNVWVTDTALHQVFRFPASDSSAPDLVLGQAFVPGNDQFHFCKPTDVQISSAGVAYISDGYCNSRIVIVSPEGKVIGSIANGDLYVAHSLTLIEKDDLICVADREGRRVACYTAGLNGSQAGKLVIDLRNQIGRVYAIDHLGDILFAVNGPDDGANRPDVVAIDLPTERLIAKYEPETGFTEPHDVALTADGQSFFVVDTDARSEVKVHKFDLIA